MKLFTEKYLENLKSSRLSNVTSKDVLPDDFDVNQVRGPTGVYSPKGN